MIAVLVLAAVRNVPPGSEAHVTVSSWRQAGNDLVDSFRAAGTRLGLWAHFTAQFSGMVFALLWGYPFMTVGLGYSPELAGGLLTMMVLAAVVIGPVLGRLTAAYPLRRSNLIFGILVATIGMWTVVLLWPGAAPLPIFVVLVLVLAAYGPGSAVGLRLRPDLQSRPPGSVPPPGSSTWAASSPP